MEEVGLFWDAHQAAVVAVDPVVVIAGEARGAAALGQHHLIAAMGADIVERLNSVIAAARHHDRRVPDLDGLGEEAALFGKLFHPAHGQPGALEQIFAFSLEIGGRSDEHTSELQSLMRISYAVFCLKKKNKKLHKKISNRNTT